MKKRGVNILDVTIRDGSYAVSFKYTAEQIKRIIAGLISAGVEWAEIGHGVGFGAGRTGMPCATPDEEQIKAAASASARGKKRIKLGVIGTPPVLKLEELKAVAKKLHFVRLACNVTSPEILKEIIPACRKLGLKVFVQMMRASAVTPKEAAKSAKRLAGFGAEVIYIVDTAGCLLPSEVPDYIRRVRDASGTDAGFHAHNNLMLALANTLAAVEAGASFVDASLKGVGRGSGNVPIEMLVLALKRLKFDCRLDERRLIDSADELHDKLLKYLPRPPGSDAYLASKRRDYFPFQLLEIIAKETKSDIFDLIDRMEDKPAGSEITIDQIGDIVEEMGFDENEIFRKIGLIPSV